MSTKWSLINLLVTCSVALLPVKMQNVTVTVIVWENNNSTCPERAVCTDVFLSTRQFVNGTRYKEIRFLHNCLCPGGSVCPFENPSHLLYASAVQRLYTCRATCQLAFCRNVNTTPVVSSKRLSHPTTLGGKMYYRMDCRCPRHHIPNGDSRAVQDVPGRPGEYVCRTTEAENLTPDPCAV